MHTVRNFFIAEIEKRILDCGVMWVFFRCSCMCELLKICFLNFFLISDLSFQIIPALSKCGSFLTLKAGYILHGRVFT